MSSRPRDRQPGEDDDVPAKPVKRMLTVCMKDVKPEVVRYLWAPWIPFGKISVCDGLPGEGKTTMMIDAAARATSGRPMPDGTHTAPCSLLFISYEDGLGDTLQPRAMVAGANPERVHVVTAIELPNGDRRLPMIPTDIDVLEESIRGIQKSDGTDGVLVVIDPIAAAWASDIETHRDSDVRRGLAPLAALAERTSAAIVLIRHLNKNAGTSALLRGSGSIGIAGAARMVMLVGRDKSDPDADVRVLCPVKCNLSKPPAALRFALRSAGAVARIEWLGESAADADAIVNPVPPASEPKQRDHAADFLRDLLASGPALQQVVLVKAAEAGIAERTLNRAKKLVGVVSRKEKGTGSWYWRLPVPGAVPTRLLDGMVGRVGNLGNDRQERQGVHDSQDATGEAIE